MGRSSSNFGGYRGRRTLTDILRIIAVALAVVVVLVLAGLFVLQDYLVYTDDGLRVELPFFREEEPPEGKALDPGSITVKEQGGRSSYSPAGQPEGSPVSPRDPENALMGWNVGCETIPDRVRSEKTDKLRERPAAACSSALSVFHSRKCKKQKIMPFPGLG